jgi:hypothetical protein
MLMENDKEIMTLKSEENSEESVGGKECCNVWSMAMYVCDCGWGLDWWIDLLTTDRL